jgi:hypothetical protein
MASCNKLYRRGTFIQACSPKLACILKFSQRDRLMPLRVSFVEYLGATHSRKSAVARKQEWMYRRESGTAMRSQGFSCRAVAGAMQRLAVQNRFESLRFALLWIRELCVQTVRANDKSFHCCRMRLCFAKMCILRKSQSRYCSLPEANVDNFSDPSHC